MKEPLADFEYNPSFVIPKEFRQVDWTYTNLHGRPFSEVEDAFGRLRELADGPPFDTGNPFVRLHFLRAIEDRLVALAMESNQPLEVCLKQLQRRLDLEYGRDNIYGKAALAVLVAKYAAEHGQRELAKSLLTKEREQLAETAKVCQAWMGTIAERLNSLGS